LSGVTRWTAVRSPFLHAHSLSSCSHVPRHSKPRSIRAARLMPLARPGAFLPGGHAFRNPSSNAWHDPSPMARQCDTSKTRARAVHLGPSCRLLSAWTAVREQRTWKQLTRGRAYQRRLCFLCAPTHPPVEPTIECLGKQLTKPAANALRNAFQPHPSNAPHPPLLSSLPSRAYTRGCRRARQAGRKGKTSLSMKRQWARAAAARP
jgi:hypothetical protein